MSLLSQRIASAFVAVSLLSPFFAHAEDTHVFEALISEDAIRQTIAPDMDCSRAACLDHHEKHEPHWHSSRREDEELDEAFADTKKGADAP
jgi:hypothetical protein